MTRARSAVATIAVAADALAASRSRPCPGHRRHAAGSDGRQRSSMLVPLFKSRVVAVEEPTGRVSVGNPDVADIVVISPTQMYVLAKDIGTTNVMFWGRDNRLLGSINLEVTHDLDGLKSKLHQLMPDEPIEVLLGAALDHPAGRASNVLAMNAALQDRRGLSRAGPDGEEGQGIRAGDGVAARGQVGRHGHQPDRGGRLAAGDAVGQGRRDRAHRAEATERAVQCIAKGVDGALAASTAAHASRTQCSSRRRAAAGAAGTDALGTGDRRIRAEPDEDPRPGPVRDASSTATSCSTSRSTPPRRRAWRRSSQSRR